MALSIGCSKKVNAQAKLDSQTDQPKSNTKPTRPSPNSKPSQKNSTQSSTPSVDQTTTQPAGQGASQGATTTIQGKTPAQKPPPIKRKRRRKKKSSSKKGRSTGQELKALEKKISKSRAEWFYPQLYPISNSSQIYQKWGRKSIRGFRPKFIVVMEGKTLPLSEISINKTAFLYIRKKGSKKRIPKSIRIPAVKTRSDGFGYFKVITSLPAGRVQVSLEVQGPTGRKKSYALTFINRKNGTIRARKSQFKSNPLGEKKFKLSTGLGANYLDYSLTSPQLKSDLNHQSFAGPSLYLGARWKINPKWRLFGALKHTPGTLPESETITVSNNKYSWNIFTLNGSYTSKNFYTSFVKFLDTEMGIIFGVQHHIVPFLSRTGNASNDLEMVPNSLTLFALGGSLKLAIDARWHFESFMRYQHPLATGDVFSITPKFAFDGSIGIVRKTEKSLGKTFLDWGVFWYGQWHSYSFVHYDRFLASNIEGEQSLFFSNIEFRVGYNFDRLW